MNSFMDLAFEQRVAVVAAVVTTFAVRLPWFSVQNQGDIAEFASITGVETLGLVTLVLSVLVVFVVLLADARHTLVVGALGFGVTAVALFDIYRWTLGASTDLTAYSPDLGVVVTVVGGSIIAASALRSYQHEMGSAGLRDAAE